MTAPRHVGVLDIGKTNAKLALVDMASLAEIAVRKTENLVRQDGPYPHFDVDRLWFFFQDALADFAATHGIDALSVTTHGASAALVAGDDLALPILDYEHDGPQRTARLYDELRPAFAETGSPRLPLGLNLGAQLFWQAAAFDKTFARADAIVTYPQYWAWRLTGTLAAEATSLGCHTDLWNPGARTFSSLVTRLGWQSRLPPLLSAFDRIGPVKPEIARRLGLATDLPVACGIHDSNASLLPHLIRSKPPFAVLSTGTWVVAFAVGGGLVGLDPARDTLVNVDAHGNPVPSARFMGGREFEELTGGAAVEPAPEAVAHVLDEKIMVLPSVISGSGPFPTAEACWTRPRETLSPEQVSAAASLYLALMSQTCLSLSGASGPTVIEGPFAHNRLFAAALAALTGRPVMPGATGVTGTSVGAALLCREEGMSQSAILVGGEEAVALSHPAFAGYATAWTARAAQVRKV